MNGQHATIQDSSYLEEVPAELLEIIQSRKSPQFLEALSVAALKPTLTSKLFARYYTIFADTCARWSVVSGKQEKPIIEAFAKVLPLAPHLGAYLEKYLSTSGLALETSHSISITCLSSNAASLSSFSTLELQSILLAAFRLCNFDGRIYFGAISAATLQTLFQHEDRAVRYLAIRIFCLLRYAADFKLEQILEKYVGDQEAVLGDFDGKMTDLVFLNLLENSRLENVLKLRELISQGCSINMEIIAGLSPLVVQHSNVLLPRPNGPPMRSSTLISTTTTSRNMEALAKALLQPSPVLLHGLAGSGKTSLVNDFARELGNEKSMVTLHLNEQTDAKMLIGMYTTGVTPGSFTWRAGVLTTAIREGRWVFIEDLDRAPNEVISVILPLIERGELLIPSRGETVKAGSGFKLFASIRSSLSVTGQENPPALHMLGARLWQRVPIHTPTQDEFRTIIDGTYPILHEFLPQIISVYDRLYTLSHKPSFASKSRTSLGRPISPRDLLKWCHRLDNVLRSTGSKTGREVVSDATLYMMFQEAADCFAGSLQAEDARRLAVSCIAEEWNIPIQTVEHYLTAHIPRYQSGDKELVVGRASIKRNPGRVTKAVKKPRTFANTNHAKRLLEAVGVAVSMAEPVLLVGETGIGKTTVVQQLADMLGYTLTAVNLSQQSEVSDLLGGYKPVNIRSLAIPLKEEFEDLFAATGISRKSAENQKWLSQLEKYVREDKWDKVAKLWRQGPKMYKVVLAEIGKKERVNGVSTSEQPAKRQKRVSKLESLMSLESRWAKFSQSLEQFDIQLSGGSKGFAFTFVEGNIIKAARNGDWVLLDEINLASPDTLESIADLLHSGTGNTPSILLSETGEIERVQAHPNFRIFGAMNPATDVGKRDLPIGLRSRFTEIYVESPDRDKDDLIGIIKAYIKGTSSDELRAVDDVASLYINTKRYADDKRIVDGANQVPHFSLRTLTRVLTYVTDIAPSYGLRRALYEGFAMGFLTLLDRESEKLLEPLINHHLLDPHGNSRSLLTQTLRHPSDGRQYARFMNQKKDRQYWMLQGIEPTQEQPHYIITPFVERNMLNLVRATSTRRFPVLVQGPTSSGKTSMIEYLAKFSGNKFVRINNHEHTDLQEYLGTYVSGSDGQLRFQEGLLVRALRQGHWIVLDELNLAPTDVLEALNRLLDDNRELLIPETQEIVRPHENFMLFATQNPPGLYGGRKTLSRAFRNRFLELHFDDIPEDELHIILERRSQVAPSDCKRIVSVYKELSRLRQSQRLFEQKDSFATLRDLFRWALRDAENREQLAANGYMLLGERVRNPEERLAVKDIIEKVFKVKIDPAQLYNAILSPEVTAYNATSNSQGVVWTQAMQRLYFLVAQALRNNEPVLLDIITLLTVLGLTPDTVDIDVLLELYSSLSTADIGRAPKELLQRIEANRLRAQALFEWSDGSLVQAMREGQFFLLDEISLADDSVLERLNSVLETQRTILLAEKGITDSFVQAVEGFQFFATMNPGGDYGKRELSPALRNRFTEIWVPSLSEHEDILQIVDAKLAPTFRPFSSAMVLFAEWFGQTYRSSASTSISVRDVLAWVNFMNSSANKQAHFAVLHGAAMVFIDTLGANPAALLAINPESIREERVKCLSELSSLLQADLKTIYFGPVEIVNDEQFSIGGFSILKNAGSAANPSFAFEAPTTKMNAMRVLRALQVQKPILIEGSPGVGKTTLISALARACGKNLTRINLSEQTDLMDLFGSDVPVEGAEAGHFAWRDAPFLQAMQSGDWVLLDEMNLASQSALEGLNACLDHRGEVYISELDQTFKRHPNFSVFAAQNPHHQGGGRKGLPASFVNRFTVVYADVFRNEDLELICKHNFSSMPEDVVATIIRFVSQLEDEIVHKRRFGSLGGPWEFNLRDTLRWLQLLSSSAPFLASASSSDFLNLIFRLRFRSSKDRREVDKLFAKVFGSSVPFRHFFHNVSPEAYQKLSSPISTPKDRLPELESIMMSGSSGSGKTRLLQHIAAISGKSLVVFPLNADVDTMDLVGGFEQVDPQRNASAFLEELYTEMNKSLEILEILSKTTLVSSAKFSRLSELLRSLEKLTSVSKFGTLATPCRYYSQGTMKVESARFEWVDGVLIKALEQGKWLVLDNANLCSASVLDRLNSLLEPNGFLSINEHCMPNGDPKIVKPHSDFRIFLTMDPRFGELSRAMRNRAIEIYLQPLETDIQPNPIAFEVETTMQRYNAVSTVLNIPDSKSNVRDLITQVAIENLSWSDLSQLQRYIEAARSSELVTVPFLFYYPPCTDSTIKIFHPLQNSPFVSLLQKSTDSSQVHWLAAVFDMKVEINKALEGQRSQGAVAGNLKASAMNRLQLSINSDRLPNHSNDSTVRVSNFLSSTLRALDVCLQNSLAGSNNWMSYKKALNALLRYWWDTYYLVTEGKFEEAAIQAHLAIGADLISHLTTSSTNEGQTQIIDFFRSSIKADFGDGFNLRTGLSMEILWKQLRPIVISTQKVMDNLLHMEELAERFDAIRWNVSISVTDLGHIVKSLIKAYYLIVTSDVDSTALLLTLTDELQTLEADIGREEDSIKPFMITQFEALRQFQTLDKKSYDQDAEEDIDFDTIVLANHSTVANMQLKRSSKTSRSLQVIDYLWGSDDGLYPIADTFAASLLHRMKAVSEVDLKSLRLLETELPTLGKRITTSSQALSSSRLDALNSLLVELVDVIVSSHGQNGKEYLASVCSIPCSDGTVNKLLQSSETSIAGPSTPNDIQTTCHQNFDKAIIATVAAREYPAHSTQLSALAWVNFAVGAITLYVPDRAFDPDKRQRLQRDRHLKLLHTLRSKLIALQEFERAFSGQDSNLRCQQIEAEILELGEPAEVLQAIYRPEPSRLNQLQGEFNNLLKAVVYSNPQAKLKSLFASGDKIHQQELRLLQNNVNQIIRRLTESYRAYSDLTMPVVSMLRCLQIGLSMVTLATAPTSTKNETVTIFSSITPFLGGSPMQEVDDLVTNHTMEYISLILTTSAIEGVSSFNHKARQALLRSFHICYEQWKKRQEQDQKELEDKTGLYRFRGSAEDEEEDHQEEFNELFPTFEEELTESHINTAQNTGNSVIAIAKSHSSIFVAGQSACETTLAYIREMSRKIGATYDYGAHTGQQHMTGKLLPGALLLLDDQVAALSSAAVVPDTYNFYADANLPEARKLVNLIHKIQTRFRELQAVDEIGHMHPLEDVLIYCRELLQFRHTEPLAKIITKLEKVHGYMHEWQFGGWASHIHGAKTLYDNATDTIISWRRLELSTWAKLFDMESRKCGDAARSWWFGAYEITVAVPLSKTESAEDLRDYAQDLLKVLESYFSKGILGQFTERLNLLVQLQKHIEILMIDVPLMTIIHSALSNFTSMYARYETPILEHLRKGRVPLEKAMKDVLLMASWKDTNIVALRDSAKRSHHKLFKIVRKYRALLGQPMEMILKSGLPDEGTHESMSVAYTGPQTFPAVDQSALALCATTVPNWAYKNKRFIEVSKTVGTMADLCQLPGTAVEGPTYIDSFLASLISTMSEFQKATPSILTEGNKPTVKHLKLRKTNLFNDTLKELRHMGIKSVRDTDALSKQDSTSVILTRSEVLPPIKGSQGLEYYFHKAVDLAPRAREATRQHSEDLSKDQIGRSMARLEGLLHTVLKQRNFLATSVRDMITLEQMIAMANGLWSPDAYDIRIAVNTSTHSKVLQWLPNILEVAFKLLEVHTKLGETSNQDVQIALSSFIEIFTSLSRQWKKLLVLPSTIISTKRQELEQEINKAIADLGNYLEITNGTRSDLNFILNQVKPWLEIESAAITNDAEQHSITGLDKALTDICNTVFITIQEHNESIRKIPVSTEEPKWFINNDKALSSGIRALYCDTDTNHNGTVTDQLSQAFSILRGLDLSDDQTSKTAGALFAVILPIVQQYYHIVHESVTRYTELHRSTCKTTYILAKTFIQIATQGFCTPQEKSDDQEGMTDKLEGGTGLGEGEGAEDISKDIQDDENLDELAQEPNTGEQQDIENEKDAVDMADGDMEGEMGEGEENDDEEASGSDDSGDDMDEEAGDVDDLDPTAVDEKMWDGDKEEAEKDQEGDDSKGEPKKDEQVAAQDNDKVTAEEGGDSDEDVEEVAGAEQGEEIKQQDDVEKHDPYAEDGDALDLPEDMDLDGNEEEEEVTKGGEEEMQNDGEAEPDVEDFDEQAQNMEDDLDIIDLDEEEKKEDGEGDKTEEAGEKAEDDSEEQKAEDEEGLLQDMNDDANADADNAVPSDVRGVGDDQEENSDDKNDSATKAQREDGGQGGESLEQQDTAAEDGEKGRQANGDALQDSSDETHDSSEAQPFKKLGDALESWHRQQTQIRDAPEQKDQDNDQDQNNVDLSKERTEFQHLQDEEAQADDQAMGTATEDQAHALDESMAIDTETQDMPDQFQPDEVDQDNVEKDDVMSLDDALEPHDPKPSDDYEGRAGASINQAKEDRDKDLDAARVHAQELMEEDVEGVDEQLESTHLDTLRLVDPHMVAEARQQWTHYEALTRDLSLSLTEQLRLILAPTLATKMRGDFRTGKRLNIKRIIPYIASQYKRDKIWMRRSVPSKRSYQIMLSVDDSKSMGESGSGSLAFETLVMVSKSLSMLEVGEICVVGFGKNVRVAHDFDTPFSSDAGPKVFQNFGFDQEKTDITKLVRESIELFRTARSKASGSPADLWQMQLIISDGVCNSSEHEPIRQLLRQALEERIMMVFVIVDDLRNKKKGESVMDLKEAKFVNGEVKIERYLDTFPFQYYLIVSDVKELPGVLATLLRQWFSEVVDSSN
ncbi:hypothetical protein BJ878DRAFT_583161 [Calycina marina]|uniref:Midasin n=1 Tax=Calycina marina TaxID=1763456 RepID=A0A9P7Z1A3_9HELO|nr:hypothetical protein BJ878DRAFT_583161 [Calycina marina]